MNKTKKITLILFSAIFTLSMFTLSTLSFLSKAEGNNVGGYDGLFGELTLDSFELYDGAYIRTDTPTGIRFETGIRTADKNMLPKNASFGTLITLESYLNENELLTFNTLKYVDIPVINWLSTTPSKFGQGYEGYFGTIVGEQNGNQIDFEKNKYNEIFVARGYVKFNIGGEEKLFYTKNSVTRTMAGIAEKAVELGDDRDFIKSIVNDAKAIKTINLNFETNGGSAVSSKDFVVGTILDQTDIPDSPTRLGSKFLGWYKDENLTESFEFSGILTESTTVYAKWENLYEQLPASALSMNGNSSEYTYSAQTMSGTDSKLNTYLYSHDSQNALSSSSTLSLNTNNSLFAKGNYLAIEFYLKSRTVEATTGLYEKRLIENVNNPTNKFLIYDQNNNLVPDRMVGAGSGWYKAVIEIENVSNDKVFMIGNNSEIQLYVSNVIIYTSEGFELFVRKTDFTSDISQTEYDLIKDGKSEYEIVVSQATLAEYEKYKKKPSDYDLYDTNKILYGYETKAILDLQEYFAQATGAELGVLSEDNANFSTNNSKYIVIGDTNIATTNGVNKDGLSSNARSFKIKQIGSNVIINGCTDIGTLNGVYEFLHHQFGFEPYSLYCKAIQTNVINCKLLAFDVCEIPEIEYTHGYYHLQYREDALDMRMNYFTDIFVSATGQPWHNSFSYVYPNTYQYSNPEWYVTDSYGNLAQLNYTLIGQDGQLSELQQVVYNKMVTGIKKDFDAGKYYKYIGFGHEDNTLFASDSAYDKYGDGARSAMLIKFINPIADKVKEYMTQNYPDREMNIVINAYLTTEKPPVKEVSGQYQAYDDSVVLRDNVRVLIAPIKADYAKEFSVNNDIADLIEQWNAITTVDEHLYWFYDNYQLNSLIYFDNTYNIKNLVQLTEGSSFVFIENTQPDSFNTFGELKSYLTSKLTWDSTLDTNALVDSFFDNYYGLAGESMFKVFDTMLSYLAPMLADKRPDGQTEQYFYQTTSGASYFYQSSRWTLEVLTEMSALIEKAYADINGLTTTNPELYEQLWARITRESFMIRYLLLEHYPTQVYSSQEFDAEKQSFLDDCAKLNITRYSNKSSETVQTLMDSLIYA